MVQSHFKKLKFEDFVDHSQEEIVRQMEELKSWNQKVKSKYEKLNQEIQESLQTKASLETRYKMSVDQLLELQKNMSALQENIEDEIRKGNVQGMEYDVKILGRGRDVETEAKKIKKVQIAFRA